MIAVGFAVMAIMGMGFGRLRVPNRPHPLSSIESRAGKKSRGTDINTRTLGKASSFESRKIHNSSEKFHGKSWNSYLTATSRRTQSPTGESRRWRFSHGDPNRLIVQQPIRVGAALHLDTQRL